MLKSLLANFSVTESGGSYQGTDDDGAKTIEENPFTPLLQGERIDLSVKECYCPGEHPHLAADDKNWVKGVLIITSYRLLFVDGRDRTTLLFEVPLLKLKCVTKTGAAANDKLFTYLLHLNFRDSCFIKLAFNPLDGSRRKVYEYLTLIIESSPTDTRNKMFCFAQNKKTTLGRWFDPEQDFLRQGATSTGGGWRMSTVNENFKMCGTYPEKLCVPSTLTDSDVENCSKFRMKNRAPVLSYYHKRTRAAMTRSSQPLTGLLGKRDAADEKLVASLSSNKNRIEIIDLRPRCNAEAQKLQGGGYEDETAYDTTVTFANIDNIHVIREVYKKMETLSISPKISRWLAMVDDTQCFTYLALLMDSANNCAKRLGEGVNLLLHCSDGWDRTAQVVSLTQLLIDPHCRTIQGFSRLVEREWVHAGHKFKTRSGFGASSSHDASPIFLQFLDCTYQLLNQFPTSFEFSHDLLLLLADSVSSGRFGTFICDNSKEIRDSNILPNTPSVWDYVQDNPSEHRNVWYEKTDVTLEPDTRPHALFIWKEYFFRYSGGKAVPPDKRKLNSNAKWEGVARELAGVLKRVQNELWTARRRLWKAYGEQEPAGEGRVGSLTAMSPLAGLVCEDAEEGSSPGRDDCAGLAGLQREYEMEIKRLHREKALMAKEINRLRRSRPAPDDDTSTVSSENNHDDNQASSVLADDPEDLTEDFDNFDNFWLTADSPPNASFGSTHSHIHMGYRDFSEAYPVPPSPSVPS